MAYYNLTNFTDATNIADQFIQLNKLADNWLGIILLMVIGIILMLSMKNYPIRIVAMASTFILTIFSFLLRTMGLIPDYVVLIMIIFTGGSILISYLGRESG